MLVNAADTDTADQAEVQRYAEMRQDAGDSIVPGHSGEAPRNHSKF